MSMGGRAQHRKKKLGAALFALAAAAPWTEAAAENQESSSEPAGESSQPDVKQVLVSGAPRNKTRASPKDISAASTVISKEELEAAGTTSAAVLARVPGVQVARTGTSADFASAALRGASSAQAPVYLAGIRLNDDVTGTADLSTIPLWMMDRVEVFRGNAPEQSDQLGLGGAVFFEPSVPKENRLGAGAGAGSFGEFSLWTRAAVSGESASALFGIRRDRAENNFPYVNYGHNSPGEADNSIVLRENADFEAYDAWAVGRFLAGPAEVRTIFNAFQREQGLAGTDIFPVRAARARAQRMLGGMNISLPCAASNAATGQIPCLLTLTTAASLSHGRIDDPYNQIIPGKRFENAGTRFSQAARIQYDALDNLRIALQASQSSELVEIDRDRGNALSARRWVSRAALSAQWAPRPWFSVLGLAAIECHLAQGQDALASRNAGDKPCGAALAPQGRLGLRLKPNDHIEILANGGRYVRVPTLAELYGSSFFVGGNSTLTPETGWSADIGLRAYKRGFLCTSCQAYLDVFAFSRWVSNIIVFKQSNFGLVRPNNEGEARVLGTEMAGWIEAFRHLHLEMSAAWMEPRITTPGSPYEGKLLPFRSRGSVSPYIEGFWELSQSNFYFNRLALGARLLYRSLRYFDQGNLGKLPEQTTLDAEASGIGLGRRVSLRLSVRNLLNERQFDYIGFPLPGRSFHGAMEGFW